MIKGAHLWECREEGNMEKGRDEEGKECKEGHREEFWILSESFEQPEAECSSEMYL